MRYSTVGVLLLMISVSSCTKKNSVHFHGRLTYSCGQVPVPNCVIQISRGYDNGQNQGSFVAQATTDNNGYYSIVTEVSEPGYFLYYTLTATSNVKYAAYQYFQIRNYNNSSDEEIDMQLLPLNVYSFHIKNTSPVNYYDDISVFSTSNGIVNDTIAFNLLGESIDTTIIFLSQDSVLNYEYTIRKDFTPTNSPIDSIASVGCIDTTGVNIFY